MATATAQPRTTSSSQPAANKSTLSQITNSGNNLPNRYVIHGVEGVGKSSLGAQFPMSVFVQTKGETGLETLINAGRIAPTPHFPESATWDEMLSHIKSLIAESHDYKTFVLDTVNGAERLCHEHVCHIDFADDWSDKGFASYQKGPEVALGQWRVLLSLLDELRLKRKMTILMLCHTKVAAFRNPLGADYDRFQPDLDKRTWSLTAKWSDAILFANFESMVSSVKENKKTGEQKGKGVGGKVRILYTERDAAYDAKNRLGLAPEIEMGATALEAFANFKAAIKAGRAVVEVASE